MLLYKINVMVKKEATSIRKDSLVQVSNTWEPPDNIGAKGFSVMFNLGDSLGAPVDDSLKYG